MVMVSGEEIKATVTLESGNLGVRTVSVCTVGRMVIFTKENSRNF